MTLTTGAMGEQGLGSDSDTRLVLVTQGSQNAADLCAVGALLNRGIDVHGGLPTTMAIWVRWFSPFISQKPTKGSS